jgi:hypothetical protein
MNSLIRVCLLAVLFASLAYTVSAGNRWERAAIAYRTLPLTFEPRGTEAGSRQQFVTHVAGHRVVLGASGAVLGTLRFVGARPNVQPQPDGLPAGRANYLVGARPEHWRLDLPLFRRIKYANLYPGIDLIYYGNENRLEYDLVVTPGASWRSIRLALPDAYIVNVDNDGDLRLQTGSGWIVHGRPMVYQRVRSGRREVSAHYALRGAHEVGFDLGVYDPSRPLIIDPTLAFASYLGGSGDDYGHAVAVDGSGCTYVVGETGSAGFPTLGAEQASMAGDTDVFVTKWNAAGTGLMYSTYIGGSNRDVALGVAVDAAGDAYVTGFTYSGDFPITSGALRASFVGDSKAFVIKLNPAGNGLVYSTFLGGSGDDYGAGIAVDAAGEAHIAGYTASVDFPTATGAFQQYYGGGSYDGFLAKLNAAGSALVFATYLGGIGNDTAAGVALDPSGNIYVTGQTQSANFPTLNPLQATSSESDAFVVKMSASGQVQYATYLGGTGLNNGTAIAADAAGNAYVTGFTNAPDFPVTSNAHQAVNNGSYDAFVATLNAYGSTVLNATYLGGSGSDISYGIALDGSGNIFITGSTNSVDFPTQAAVQPVYNGGGDAFVAAFNNQLTGLYYATYLGGSQSDVAAAIAVDFAGDAYVTGWTASGELSSGFPVTAGVFQPEGQGGLDAFLTELSFSGGSVSCSASSPQTPTVPVGASELVGDLMLSCSGGVLGAQASTNFQVALNANVASASQPQLFIGSNTNPVWGVLSGANAILFQGVSFTVPGPTGMVTLRITNVQANVSPLSPGAQVTMAVSALDSSPSITLVPAQQTVAVVQNSPTPQVQQFLLSKASAPAACVAPRAVSGFLLSDPQAMVWFLVDNTSPGDAARVDWYGPSGSVYQSDSLTVSSGGTQCLWDSLKISPVGASMPGAWTVNGYWNNSLLFSAPFTISTAGLHRLIYQNQTTGQVNADYYGGTGGAALIGWACLSCGIDTTNWQVVAVADFDGNGVPDLVYQNTQTGQVNVDYYGGAGGTTFIGWACLSCGIDTTNWQVVAVADFDGNGTPDLVYQNTQTHQVNVDYYGGAGGATFIGWACLSCGIDTTDWQVKAAADFDGNGTPDLVYQNTQTHQVNVDYYGGTGGASFIGWACLSCGIDTTDWQVKAAADLDGNGIPDLIYQNTQTGQVNVDYYGGHGGAAFIGWAYLNSNPGAGWSPVSAK